jgi:hypothetical protein
MFQLFAPVKALMSANPGRPVSTKAVLIFLALTVALTLSAMPMLSALDQPATNHGVNVISDSHSGGATIAGGAGGGVIGSGARSQSDGDQTELSRGSKGEEIPS